MIVPAVSMVAACARFWVCDEDTSSVGQETREQEAEWEDEEASGWGWRPEPKLHFTTPWSAV